MAAASVPDNMAGFCQMALPFCLCYRRMLVILLKSFRPEEEAAKSLVAAGGHDGPGSCLLRRNMPGYAIFRRQDDEAAAALIANPLQDL